MTKTLLFFLCLVSIKGWSQNDTNGGIVPQNIVVRCDTTKRPETSLRISCSGSLSNRNKPLVVVDGVVSDSDELKAIDQNAIERIHILKNTDATAIYGSKAVNGVILVTTKKIKTAGLLVLDETDSMPVNGATVSLLDLQKTRTNCTDRDGLVSFSTLNKGRIYSAEITCVGYSPFSSKIRFDSTQTTTSIFLKRTVKKLDEVVISHGDIMCRRCGGCGLRVTRVYNYDIAKTPETKFSFTVYPNPVQRTSLLTILPKLAVNGFYQVISSGGQVLQSGRLKAGPEQPFLLSTSSWPWGTYFIRMADASSSKQVTEKFIVQ